MIGVLIKNRSKWLYLSLVSLFSLLFCIYLSSINTSDIAVENIFIFPLLLILSIMFLIIYLIAIIKAKDKAKDKG